MKKNGKKQFQIIEKIETEEKTIQHGKNLIPNYNVGELEPCLVTPYVITTEKGQTVEQAIKLTNIENSNPLELIEKIENEEKNIKHKENFDS